MSTDEKQAYREKHWEELSDTEKIERMRKEIKRYQNQITELNSFVSDLIQHEHSSKGEIVTPLFKRRNTGARGYHQDDKYF